MFTISELGRKKSTSICPKCGKQGYKRIAPYKYGKYRRFVHYTHDTGRRPECHVERILRKRESDTFLSSPSWKLHKDDKMTAGEIANGANNYLYLIDDSLYRLGKRMVGARVTDHIMATAYVTLINYLPLYAQIGGHQTFFSSNIDFENLESICEFKRRSETRAKFMELEKKLVAIIKEFIVNIKKEYSLLIRKGGLIDQVNRYRHKSNHKLREDLRSRLQSIEKLIPGLISNTYSSIIRCSFILYLSSEYCFIKYDFPEKMKRNKKYSDDLSEGRFGSSKFKQIDTP